MKFIITESQDEMLKLEKQSDILYKLFKHIYPDNYLEDVVNVRGNETEVYSNEEKDELLFYYVWKQNEIYIGTEFINEIYKLTFLNFLDLELIMKPMSSERDEFDNIIKVFARRHYGWNVDLVYFHWY